jgi:hypothetical protein
MNSNLDEESKLISKKDISKDINGNTITTYTAMDKNTGLSTIEIEFTNNNDQLTKYQLFEETLSPDKKYKNKILRQETEITRLNKNYINTTIIKERKWDLTGNLVGESEEVEEETDTDELAAVQGDDRADNPEKYYF